MVTERNKLTAKKTAIFMVIKYKARILIPSAVETKGYWCLWITFNLHCQCFTNHPKHIWVYITTRVFYSLRWERKKTAYWNGILTCSPIKTEFALFRIGFKAPQFLMPKTTLSVKQTSFILSLLPFGKKIVLSFWKNIFKKVSYLIVLLYSGYMMQTEKEEKSYYLSWDPDHLSGMPLSKISGITKV